MIMTAIWILGGLVLAGVLAYLGYGLLCEAAARGGWQSGWADDVSIALSAELRERSARIEAGLPARQAGSHHDWGQTRLRSSGIVIPDLAYCQAA